MLACNPFEAIRIEAMRENAERKISPLAITRLAHAAAVSLTWLRFVRACQEIDKLDRTNTLYELTDLIEYDTAYDKAAGFLPLRLRAHEYVIKHGIY